MKKLFWFLFLVVVALGIWKKDLITQYIVQELIFNDYNKNVVNNNYSKDSNFGLVKQTSSFKPNSKDEFNDIFYSILNSGMEDFSFYCMFGYDECVNEFNDYIEKSSYVEAINNYVHPYNSFENISVTINNFNKIEIHIDKLYNEQEINYINEFIDSFIKNNITTNMSTVDKIKVFHDYIINNTTYDSNYDLYTDKDKYPTHPYNAYGLITENKAICSGYTDVMAIYLNKINVPNYKIASDEHVWNYVFVNNSWYHLDLTWDDPVTNNHKNVLLHDFFLINTNQLLKQDTKQHNYDKNLYLEA